MFYLLMRYIVFQPAEDSLSSDGDYRLDIMIGEGPSARSVKLELPPFTLVGATTRAGMLTNPIKRSIWDCFTLEFYNNQELARDSRKVCGFISEY